MSTQPSEPEAKTGPRAKGSRIGAYAFTCHKPIELLNAPLNPASSSVKCQHGSIFEGFTGYSDRGVQILASIYSASVRYS